MKEKHLNRVEENINEEEFVKIDEKIKDALFSALKNETDNWKKIIIAGEIALLDINILENLSDEDKEAMKEELERLRIELQETKDQKEYIDLARVIYRFKKIGLDFRELTDKERQAIEKLPQLFSKDSKWHGHLNYIPQIAKSLDKDISEISLREDYELARKYIEKKLQEGGEEELKGMIFSGLLVELNQKEANKLLDGDSWNENRWQEVLKMVRKLKEDEDGYALARCLPPLKNLINFKKNKI